MKNRTFKRILSVSVCLVLLLTAVFVLGSCKKEHVYDHSCDVDCNECGEVRTDIVHDLETVTGFDPTCTEEGQRAYEVCKNCGYSTLSVEHVIHAKGHTRGAEVIENNEKPTCTGMGAYDSVYYCEDCGIEIERTRYPVASAGHKYETVPAKTATCLPGYYEYQHCTVCGHDEGFVEIPAAYDHISSIHPIVYSPSIVAPTCTEEGSYMMAVCCTNDNCTYIFPQDDGTGNMVEILSGPYPIAAIGHNYADHEGSEPTCTKEGHTAYKNCKRCGHTEGYSVIDALGHAKVEHEAKEPTCTEHGWNAYETCERCDYSTYEENIKKKLGHTPVKVDGRYPEENFVIENLVEPTCTEDGSYDRVVYCTRCDVELHREAWVAPAVGHNIVTEIEAKEPTCTEIGWNAYICCSKCGYSENYVEIPVIAHTFVDYVVTEPTCLETGVMGNKCSVCGFIGDKQDAIAALDHTYGADGLCIRCSDRVSVGLEYALVDGGYAVVGIGSCADSEVIIPKAVNDIAVVAIAADAFKNVAKIETVIIPDSVKAIGEKAFFYCKDLKNVVIGDGVETIGDYAFHSCAKLESVTVGSGVKTIGLEAFIYCYKLANVSYNGTADAWKAISIASGNSDLTDVVKF